LDVQGSAIERGIGEMGFGDLKNVRVGKLIEIDVPDNDVPSAQKRLKGLCEKLLANTVIEDFEIRAAN
jgi:phosphoribosylformylglycinamidine synthase